MKIRKILIILVIVIVNIISVFNVKKDHSKKINHRSQWYLDKVFDNDTLYYKKYLGKREVKVAVIDSGIYNEHIDFSKSRIECYEVKGIDKNINTDWEHGTMVAGILCANAKSDDGVLGINPNMNLLCIDISDNEGIVGIDGIVEAIEYAILQNVDIINISFTTKTDYAELHDVIIKAYNNNIVIVASVGNDIDGKITYPAEYDEVIAVGAYAKNGDLLYGKVDKAVYLPGENIVSLCEDLNKGSSYISKSGTSLAAPILTGMISLLMTKYEYQNKDIYEKLATIQKIDNIEQLRKIMIGD